MQVKSADELCGLTPQPDDPFDTVLTVTVEDSDGASRQATLTVNTDWHPPGCTPALASESPASVDERTLTLTFDNALDEDSEPAAGDFEVTVAGSARSVTGVEVTGATVVLTLASAVEKGQTVTVSYTADAASPVRRADGVGDAAASFTNQAVDNATGQTPVLEGAVVVGATLTLLYDEALDEDSEPAAGDFAVTVAGSARNVTAVDVTGATVVLTLASAVTAGQAVTVGYTKGTNPIRDTHENHYEAAGFSGETVDNRTATPRRRRLLSIAVQGTTITLTYDERLDPAHEPPKTFFIVNSSESGRLTVTGVAVRGRTVVLTLASALTKAQVATLDLTYNFDDENLETAIQDFAGNRGSPISTSQNKPAGVRPTHGPPSSRPPASPPSGGAPSGGGGPERSAGAPSADAGADLEADPGVSVMLDGSGSTDPDGDALTYTWERVSWAAALSGADTAPSGSSATLTVADAARASFTAPEEPGDLVFRLTVTDPGGLTDSDEVTVTVRDLAPSFGAARVAALELAWGEAMDPVVLPEATGGNGALTYALSSAPAGLAGLSFDAATRTLSGTPETEGAGCSPGGRTTRTPTGRTRMRRS